MKLFYQKMDSPLGDIYLATDGKYLRIVTVTTDNWNRLKTPFDNLIEEKHEILIKTEKQLREYFAAKRKKFNLPTHFVGTEFQVETWHALLEIPYGKTISYSEQAEIVGRPKAVRAIGGTNGLNPIFIIAPCHRVIGKSGKLTGFASGLEHKKYLLALEKKGSPGGLTEKQNSLT